MVSNPAVGVPLLIDEPIACVAPVATVAPPPDAADAAPPSRAWTVGTPPGTWAAGALPVVFTFAAPLPKDLGDGVVAELAVAARTWGEVGCTSLRATAGPAALALTPGDDGVNGVFLHADAWPAELLPGALGQTVVTLDAQGHVRDADIHLNGVDHRWSFGTDPADGRVDARGVILHEMGHALGLGHSAEPRATMYASHPPGLGWRSLEADDRAGICALYPGAGASRCDAGGLACPASFVCVAGGCERLGSGGVVCAPCRRVAGACDGAGDDARCNDLPSPAAGRVCGRACATDTDCGARLRCVAQTAAGDLQCAPTDGCASGPNPCATDAQCTAGALCRGGACVGPAETTSTDGGTGGSGDASTSGSPSAGGGCAIRRGRGGSGGSGGLTSPLAAALAFFYAFALRKKRSRSRASPSSWRRARPTSRPTSS